MPNEVATILCLTLQARQIIKQVGYNKYPISSMANGISPVQHELHEGSNIVTSAKTKIIIPDNNTIKVIFINYRCEVYDQLYQLGNLLMETILLEKDKIDC